MEFLELDHASRRLGLSSSELISHMISYESGLRVYLDCSKGLTRSGTSLWIGRQIKDGVEGITWALPGKPTPLTSHSMEDLRGRLADHESGLNLLKGLEVLIKTNLGPNVKDKIGPNSETLQDEQGRALTEPLDEEELLAQSIPYDITVRFTGELHNTLHRPPNPSLLVLKKDLDLLDEWIRQNENPNAPPGEGILRDPSYRQGEREKIDLSKFFLNFPTKHRKPHTHFLATIDLRKNNGPQAWSQFREMVKKNKGIKPLDMKGFPLVYLKLDREQPLDLVWYKFEPFEGSTDKGHGLLRKINFLNSYYKAKKSS